MALRGILQPTAALGAARVLLALNLVALGPDPAPPGRDPVGMVSPSSAMAAPARTLHPASLACAGCHVPEATAWSTSHHALASGTDLHAERFDGVPLRFAALRVTPQRGSGGPGLPHRGRRGRADLGGDRHDWRRAAAAVPPRGWTRARPRRPRGLGYGRRSWFDPAPTAPQPTPETRSTGRGWPATGTTSAASATRPDSTRDHRPATETYASTYAHPVVACEACHGAGHSVARSGTARPRSARARRAIADTRPGLRRGTCVRAARDTVRPALVDHNLAFQADSRNSAPEEPFEWGAFSQSGMYRVGVRCSDCHDPHTGRTRGDGDQVCRQCHTDVVARHPAGTESSACIGCHMKTQLYMGIHPRHDHGMHAPGTSRLGATWTAALSGDPSAGPRLMSLALDHDASSFVRASAIKPCEASLPAISRGFVSSSESRMLQPPRGHRDARGPGRGPSRLARGPRQSRTLLRARGHRARGAPPPLRSAAFEAVREEFEATVRTHGYLGSTWQNIGGVREVVGDAAGARQAYAAALQRIRDERLRARVKALGDAKCRPGATAP